MSSQVRSPWRRTWRTQLQLWPAHVMLVLGGLLMLFPFVWQLIMSLSTNAEIQAVPPTFFPEKLRWDNYAAIFDKLPFWNQFGVSVTITIVRTFGQLVFAALAGFAFARMRFRGNNLLFGLLLVILMVPGQAYLIPQYQIIKNLGLLETMPGIFLPGLFSAFATFLLRQAFLNLPHELEDAAKLDGCNQWQTFWKIMLPLVKPSLFAVAITTVLWSWNELLWPLVVTQREPNMPLSVGIATLAGQYQSDWAVMMAASVLAMAPIFILFFAMQRRVIDGLATSGMK